MLYFLRLISCLSLATIAVSFRLGLRNLNSVIKLIIISSPPHKAWVSTFPPRYLILGYL